MVKHLLQDMVRVQTPTKKRIKAKVEAKERTRETTRERTRVKKKKGKEKFTRDNIVVENDNASKYRIYFIAFISIIFLLFALSFLFSGAKITVIPKIEEIALNSNMSATKDLNTSTLPFDLVIISGEENKLIQGGKEEDVEIASLGTVVIYNTFSTSSQVLDINTRLEGSNDKIYKTKNRIRVPGMTKDGKPGSVEVGVYASEAGQKYNSAPLDFTILGFKGTPKYSKFYARSKGDIVGGFKGVSAVVSSLDKATAVSELESILEAKLLNKITDQIPSGFILYEGAIFLDKNDRNVVFEPSENNMVLVNIKSTLYGFLFDEKKLAKVIAQDVVEGYDNEEIYVPNIRDLSFSLSNKESISFVDVKNISFNLSGVPKVIWRVDETKFVIDLLGKKKKDFNQVLLQYNNIDSAELVLRPFWKASFPEESKDIDVIVNYP